MVHALVEKKSDKNNLSAFQTLIVSTATRVGMGNLVGVVAAISAGGAGAIFWMWVLALIGSSTAFIEATLAQIYKEKILFTVATEAVLPTISTITGKKNRAENEKKFCFPYCLQFQA